MPAWKIVLSLISIVAVIVAAYISTAYLSSRTQKTRSGKSIWIRERFALSKDKSFYLVEVQGKVYFIAATNQAVTLIDTYDAGLFDDSDLKQEPLKKFSSYLTMRGGIFGGKDREDRSDNYEFSEDNLDTIYRKIKNGRPGRGDDEAQ
jgi:flagellar biogenesis protein FliO